MTGQPNGAAPKTASPKGVSQRQARSVARLAAVQALYQMEAAGSGVESVVREFHDHRFETDIDGAPLAAADEAFFDAPGARGGGASDRDRPRHSRPSGRELAAGPA